MRLLLLLSAFLTALVGQGGVAYAAPMPAAVTCRTGGNVEQAARAAVALDRKIAVAGLVAIASFHVARAPMSVLPIYGDRLLI